MIQNTARSVRFLAVLLAALSTGVFFGTSTSLGPSKKGFSPRTYIEVQQATIRNLRPVMGTLLPGAVAANLALVFLAARERRSPAFALTVVGFLAQFTSLIITGIFELPINGQVMSWSPETPPEQWATVRDRWDTFHTLRTVTAIMGLGCVVAATLTTSEQHSLPGSSRQPSRRE